MKLNYKDYGSGSPLVILHGMFGSLDNWFSLAKAFADKHHVYLVDARNHGQSPHTDTHSYDEMVEDLFEFFKEHGLKDAVLIGHSMGGKTAMMFTAKHFGLVHRLIAVDVGVKAYPVHHDIFIRSMQSLDLDTLSSRKDAEEFLCHMLEDRSIVQFLLKNIYRKKQEDGSIKYAWRFNLDVLAVEMEEMLISITEGTDIPTLFLYGTRSNYVLESDRAEILSLFPNAEFRSLETGHWVHAEDPDGFLTAVKTFIEE